jgi:hypothetical protein
MNKKIIGILVVTLLLSASALSIAGSEKVIKSTSLGEVIDQHQDWSDDCVYFEQEWQEFVPTLDKLTRVGVKIAQWYSGSPDLIMTIEKPLGTVLTTKSMPATSIPSPNCDWVSFNVPDITLIPGGSYFIKLTAPLGSEYGWGIAYNNLYPQGTSSQYPGDWCFRTYGEEELNNPPDTPSTPSGPTSVSEGVSYTYTTSTTDPDGDQVKYGFDFDNDGDIVYGHWTGFIPSGSTCNFHVVFYGVGTRYLRAKAEDEHGAQSGFSSALTIVVSEANTPPNTPSTPSGQSSGTVGVSYTYSTSADDPDGDQVWYKWDWGNEVSDWDGPYNSGDPVTTSHTWTAEGTYAVKVKAKDTSDAESVWSDPLSVTMPKNKMFYQMKILFERLIECFPLFEKILNQ